MEDQNPKLDGSESGHEDGEEFSFSVNPGASSSDPADEIFSDGKILPLYPVFDRTLLLSDPSPNPSDLPSESASSMSYTAHNYCEWAPNRAWKKSGSTGSVSTPVSAPSKGRSVRDLVVGKRSHSDGKEKLGHLKSGSGKSSSDPAKKTEMDLVTAHKLFYGKEKGGGGKNSFLPYKPDLVGLFAQSRGHHRHHNPFNL